MQLLLHLFQRDDNVTSWQQMEKEVVAARCKGHKRGPARSGDKTDDGYKASRRYWRRWRRWWRRWWRWRWWRRWWRRRTWWGLYTLRKIVIKQMQKSSLRMANQCVSTWQLQVLLWMHSTRESRMHQQNHCDAIEKDRNSFMKMMERIRRVLLFRKYCCVHTGEQCTTLHCSYYKQCPRTVVIAKPQQQILD